MLSKPTGPNYTLDFSLRQRYITLQILVDQERGALHNGFPLCPAKSSRLFYIPTADERVMVVLVSFRHLLFEVCSTC